MRALYTVVAFATGRATSSVQMLHARQVHVTVTNKHNTFHLVRLSLHTHLQNRDTQLLCALWQGKAPNYTLWLVPLDKRQRYIKSQVYGRSNSV